jgi:transcriptional regulator with XRE-family HTH domain
MISSDQIRAARALVNWSQGDLADRTGMATPSIGNIEIGKHNPSLRSQQKIITAFDEAGVEFIDDGVRKKQDLVEVIEGDSCYLELLDIAHRQLASGEEILFSGSDERRSPPAVIDKFRSMRRSGIQMRSLIKFGDSYVMGPLGEYRWMPEGVFEDGDVKVIFQNTVSFLMTWEETLKVIKIKDRHITNENRRYFEYFWSNGSVPKKSTADTFY